MAEKDRKKIELWLDGLFTTTWFYEKSLVMFPSCSISDKTPSCSSTVSAHEPKSKDSKASESKLGVRERKPNKSSLTPPGMVDEMSRVSPSPSATHHPQLQASDLFPCLPPLRDPLLTAHGEIVPFYVATSEEYVFLWGGSYQDMGQGPDSSKEHKS